MTDIREQIERLRNEGWYACNELEADAVADAMEKLLERNDILEETDIECTNEIMRLTKRNELLEAVVGQIATQRTTLELAEEEIEDGDFEGAYDMMILESRVALAAVQTSQYTYKVGDTTYEIGTDDSRQGPYCQNCGGAKTCPDCVEDNQKCSCGGFLPRNITGNYSCVCGRHHFFAPAESGQKT